MSTSVCFEADGHFNGEEINLENFDPSVVKAEDLAKVRTIEVSVDSNPTSLYAFTRIMELVAECKTLEVVQVTLDELDNDLDITIAHVLATLSRFPHPSMHTVCMLYTNMATPIHIQNVPDGWQPLACDDQVLGRPSTWHTLTSAHHMTAADLGVYAACLDRLTRGGRQPFYYLVMPICMDTPKELQTQAVKEMLASPAFQPFWEGRYCRNLGVWSDDVGLKTHFMETVAMKAPSQLRGLAFFGGHGMDLKTTDDCRKLYRLLCNDRFFPFLNTVRMFHDGSDYDIVGAYQDESVVNCMESIARAVFSHPLGYQMFNLDQVKLFDEIWRRHAVGRLLKERRQHLWHAPAVLIAALSANRFHPFRDSLFNLVPVICDMIGTGTHDNALAAVPAGVVMNDLFCHPDVVKRLQKDDFQAPRKADVPHSIGELKSVHEVPALANRMLVSAPWAPALDLLPVRPLCVPLHRRMLKYLNAFARTKFVKRSVSDVAGMSD